jgi:prepilin-type N-terminal cleavage/methylation domain-containing protein
MKPAKSSAFTLVELMVAVGIFGFMSAGVTAFYVQSLQAANATQQQVRMMADMRSITNELLFNASRAHELILYASPAAADRADATDRLPITVNEDTGALTCPTGNFAVFVYYELPKPSSQARYRIARLVGYALDQTGTNPGVLSRITIDLSSAPSTSSVEQILSDRWATATRKTYSDLVTPLAMADGALSTTTPKLFYKRSEQNLAICGQLLKSAANNDSKDRRTVTRTMFFTVTTRS